MPLPLSRREFLGTTAATTLTLAQSPLLLRAADDAESLKVGVMGTGGRGTELSGEFQQQSGVDVKYVCDVDENRANQTAKVLEEKTGHKATPITDYRKLMEADDLDIIVITTCNHWHAPATIEACKAGKHVYCEKPASHNPREGEMMVEAARKYDRKVQLGTQRRSRPAHLEAIPKLHNGEIGKVYLARCFYNNVRPSIGVGKLTDPPEELNYDLWQGPAPRKPFKDNYLHYNWHWFWHWGNGELGNNGVHFLDVCRWGMDVDYPIRVSSNGGRYQFDDDQETPDTQTAAFDFEDDKTITWTGISCNRLRLGEKNIDCIFQGTEGSMVFSGDDYQIYDLKGNAIGEPGSGPGGQVHHVANFLDAIRNDTPLNAEIEIGHKSTLLTQVGNIAYRMGRSVTCDPTNGHIKDDAEAMKLWERAYEPSWEPQV